MKILTLRFKNINSLRGEWKIDFTANQFVNNGLFAITGATGAGKPLFSMLFVLRFITKRHAFIYPHEKTK
jgi:hypothetical protein